MKQALLIWFTTIVIVIPLQSKEVKIAGYGIIIGTQAGASEATPITAKMVNSIFPDSSRTELQEAIIQNNASYVRVSCSINEKTKEGDRLDANLEWIAGLTDIHGGMLLPTHLNSEDSRIKVIARGCYATSGFWIENSDQLAGIVTKGAIIVEINSK